MASVKKTSNIRWEREGDSYRITWGDLTVCVHKYIGCGDQLFVTCHDLRIVTKALLFKDFKDARVEALRYVEDYAQKLAKTASELVIRAREPK